ncbi:LacI family DNA-binding transcriptional regulator [Synoicihabitans lomoniglobus]|uniref:LacI family DNA-binding transcriptional regulator n=1 Tax=Synoicihabitans lomoniglobus TaxID=2909285 RepID=A0AAE9ZWI9_9BACT|nr:LacI family DNA-binding transcriptional regulator [Opitutaceae bacterium LMO-M01]
MSSQRRVTLSDIAKQAEVHVTTVSLALRNHPRLPERTRTRIQKIAKELGYQPDPVLQALVAYRGKVMARRNPPTLAYLTNWSTRLGWQNVTAHPEFYAGAQAKSKELGFNLEHFWMGEPGLTHTRMSKILQTRGITGLIIASHRRETDVALHFDWSAFSAVKIDYFPHEPELHNVTNDQCNIVRLAMRQVAERGYQRIGCVMHRGWDHSVDHLWTAGFLAEQSLFPEKDRVPMFVFPELEPVEAWMAESKDHVEAPPKSFAAWFKKYQPDVILTKRSFVEPCIKQMGLQIPRDVALVDLFLDVFDGANAGVRQNHHIVGELAVEILAGQLHYNKYGVPEIPTTTNVEGTWFDGATCPPKKAAPTRKPATKKKTARAAAK